MAANPSVPLKVGKYDILHLIGRGGMGVVYKAIDPNLNRPVAIKMLTAMMADHPDHLKRFFREAQSLGNLQHPNIVTVFDLGDYGGSPYLVMQFLEGESLDTVLLGRRPMNILEKINIMLQVCQGLSYAHQRGVVHRDIKPANIMLCKDGVVKIFDFGIAYLGDGGVTTTGQIIGTLSYMSPEQVNAQPIDARTDLFSAGVVLYQLFTGHLPFEGETTATTLLKIVHDPPPPLASFLSDYPPELEEILNRALAKSPDDRYSSAQEFALDLGVLQGRLKLKLVGQELRDVTHLIESGEPRKARESLLRVLKIDEHNTEANRLLREVQQAIRVQESAGQLRTLREEAEKAVAGGRYDDAAACAERAFQVDRNSSEAAALEEWVKAETSRAEKLRHALRIAEKAHQEGRLDTAKRAVEGALELSPDHTEVKALHRVIQRDWEERERQQKIEHLLTEAQQDLSSQRFTAALDLLSEAEKLNPQDPKVQALIESAKTGRERERRRRQIDALVRDVEDALNQDDYASACSKASAALTGFPDEPTLLKLQALAERQRQTQERKQFIDEQLALARTLLPQNRNEELKSLLESALARTGPEPRLQSLLDIVRENVARDKSETQKAELIQKAKDFLRNNSPDEAVHVLEGIAKEHPGDSEIHDLLERANTERANMVRDAIWRSQQESVLDLRIQILQEALQKAPQEPGLEKQLQSVQDLEQLISTTADAARKDEESGEYAAALAKWEALRSAYRYYPNLDKNIERLRKLCEQVLADSRSRWVQQISEALNQGAYAEALSLARSAKTEYPWDPEFMDFEEKAERGAQQRDKAQKKLAEARRLFANRHWEQGGDIVIRAVQMSSRDPVLLEQASGELIRACESALVRDWRAAEAIVRRLSEFDEASAIAAGLPGKIESRRREDLIQLALSNAETARLGGDLDGALREISPALTSFPEDTRLRGFADRLQEQVRQEQERARSEEVRRKREAFVNAVSAKVQQETSLQARINVLEDSLKQEPDDSRLLAQLQATRELLARVTALEQDARSYEDSGRLDTAIAKWEAMRSLHPQYPELSAILERLRAKQQQEREQRRQRWVERIEQEENASRYEDALDLMRDASSEFPDDRSLAGIERRLRSALDRRARAQRSIEEAAKFVGKKQWKKVASAYLQASEAAPADSVALERIEFGLTEATRNALASGIENAEVEMLLNALVRIAPTCPQMASLKAALAERAAQAAPAQSESQPHSGLMSYFHDAFRSITLTESPENLGPLESKTQQDSLATGEQPPVRNTQVQEPTIPATRQPTGPIVVPTSSRPLSDTQPFVRQPAVPVENREAPAAKAVEPPKRDVETPVEAIRDAIQSVASPVPAAVVPETPKTVAEPEPGVNSDATIRAIERQLAEFLGPLAKIVVKRAVAQTRNPEELHAIVARSLDREDDRRKFLLRKAEVLSQKSKAPSAPPEAAPLPEPQKEVRSGSLEVTAAELDRAVKLLTPYVGPIASVLVKKAARNVDSLSALYLALAGHVKEAAGRRTFLRDAGFREP